MTTFETIQAELNAMLRRALEVEARHRGLDLPPTLLEEATDDAGLRETFGEEAPLALVAFDTPGIQRYLFRVRRPVDLFGGSKLVADFTKRDAHGRVSIFRHLAGSVAIPSEAVIYAGGGGGLMIVARCEAEPLVDQLETILAEATHGDLRSVATWLAAWPADLSAAPPPVPEGFETAFGPARRASRYAATVSALFARLARRRSTALRLAPTIEPHRYRERCDVCGRRVGRAGRNAEGQEERRCDGCEARREYGGRTKREEDQAKTFEDMVEGLDENALAVVYADGANVGGAFERLASMAQHRALSLAVDEAMEAARCQVYVHCPWLGTEDGVRVQTPLRGGDDLVMVLPATVVFDVLPGIVRAFEAGFDLDAPPLRGAFAAEESLRSHVRGFGLGVGVAIAPARFPIQFLLDYAGTLLRSAKASIRRAREAGRDVRSAVDFLVIRSGTPLSTTIESVRRRHDRRPPEGEEPALTLTRKPYSIDELEALIRRVRALAEHVPPSQVHAIRREIDAGHAASRSLWRYQHARAQPGKGWAAWRDALDTPLDRVDDLLWRPKSEAPEGDASEEARSTDFVDAVEIFDLVRAGSPASPASPASPSTDHAGRGDMP